MTDRQNNQYSMIKATDDVLQKHKPVWQPRLTFANVVKIIEDALPLLAAAAQERGRDTSGIAVDKHSLQLSVAHKADYIGDIIQAYALEHDNMELYRAMMFSWSEVLHLADNESYAKMMEVYNQGTSLFTPLKDYGLAQADLDRLKADADAFSAKIAAPRTAVGEKKDAGQTIDEIIRTCTAALHRLDKMINTFAAQSEAFVNQYKSARIIVDAGHGKKAAPQTFPGS